MAIKITGVRSIKSKLERMAAELESDTGERKGLAMSLEYVANGMRVITIGLKE